MGSPESDTTERLSPHYVSLSLSLFDFVCSMRPAMFLVFWFWFLLLQVTFGKGPPSK